MGGTPMCVTWVVPDVYHLGGTPVCVGGTPVRVSSGWYPGACVIRVVGLPRDGGCHCSPGGGMTTLVQLKPTSCGLPAVRRSGLGGHVSGRGSVLSLAPTGKPPGEGTKPAPGDSHRGNALHHIDSL